LTSIAQVVHTSTLIKKHNNDTVSFDKQLCFLREIGEFAYSNSFDIEVSPIGSGHGSSVEKPPAVTHPSSNAAPKCQSVPWKDPESASSTGKNNLLH
jgi:hypothetical protein